MNACNLLEHRWYLDLHIMVHKIDKIILAVSLIKCQNNWFLLQPLPSDKQDVGLYPPGGRTWVNSCVPLFLSESRRIRHAPTCAPWIESPKHGHCRVKTSSITLSNFSNVGLFWLFDHVKRPPVITSSLSSYKLITWLKRSLYLFSLTSYSSQTKISTS
jgi:hypothetical protein